MAGTNVGDPNAWSKCCGGIPLALNIFARHRKTGRANSSSLGIYWEHSNRIISLLAAVVVGEVVVVVVVEANM